MKNRKKWSFPPYFDSCLRKRWRKMVLNGIATKQQAYTLGWMEFFVEAIFMLGCIDFPSDSAAILRVKAFVEALIDSERERCDDEPSYLFDDGEEIAFAAGGLMDGASDSADQAVLSAILITTKRILAFSSIDAPPRRSKVCSGNWIISILTISPQSCRHRSRILFPHRSVGQPSVILMVHLQLSSGCRIP